MSWSKRKFLQDVAAEFGQRDPVYELHKRFIEKYGQPQQGRNRAAYVAGTFVVKIPISYDGITDNDWEGSVSAPDLARTRLVYWKSVPVLLMERVQWLSEKELEKFGADAVELSRSTDCGQVGLNKKGKIVAFDYGLT